MVGIDQEFMQICVGALCTVLTCDTKQIPCVGIPAVLPAFLNPKFIAPEVNYLSGDL
jgi:hypothetical protein